VTGAVDTAAGLTLAPTGRPHRWQNLAPGESDASHPAQVVASSEAPQFAQKRPVPAVAHAGQATVEVEDSVMRYNLLGATTVRTVAPVRGNCVPNSLAFQR
jgi:hypothetical protein